MVDYLHLGYTNEQIGLALGTRPRTVRNQLTAVYRKLGVATRAEAVGLVARIESPAAAIESSGADGASPISTVRR